MSEINVSLRDIEYYERILSDADERIQTIMKRIQTKICYAKNTWDDYNYRKFESLTIECVEALKCIYTEILAGETYLKDIVSTVSEYDDFSFSGEQASANWDIGNGRDSSAISSDRVRPITRHLSRDETNERWKATVLFVDTMIGNYKEELLARGVPDGTWMTKTLATHRARMLEQEAYNLDVASGHIHDSTNSPYAYPDIGDYSSFYDSLANEYRDYCLNGTDPNY